jgi:hypothetical protein
MGLHHHRHERHVILASPPPPGPPAGFWRVKVTGLQSGGHPGQNFAGAQDRLLRHTPLRAPVFGARGSARELRVPLQPPAPL